MAKIPSGKVVKSSAKRAAAGFKKARKTGNKSAFLTTRGGGVKNVAGRRGAAAGVATRGVGKNKKTAAGVGLGAGAAGGATASRKKRSK